MAVFWNKVTNLFNGYREQNSKNLIVQQQAPGGKFGQDAIQKNPNIVTFDHAKSNIADIVDRRSVVSRFQTTFEQTQENAFSSSVFAGITAMPVLTNKQERIRQYRAMSLYPECDFCINELADDFLHEDEDGEFIKLVLPDESTLNDDQKEVLQSEFKRIINLFNMKDEAYNLMRRFIIDGEIAFENIINPNAPDLGIIGVKYLPTEYYETLVDPHNGKTIGIIFDKEKLDVDIRNILSNSAVGAKAIFNNTIAQTYADFKKENAIPLLWPQVTYISSGETSPDGMICFPLVEKCKQAYHQLALMQDAAVILRVTRAPERLLFNINVGGMADKVARQRIKQFENEYKSKKILNYSGSNGKGGEGEITSVYNPVTMLECFFSGKTNANDGTTVETVSSTADYEQITDIEYFLRRLFKAFKVPFTRYKVPENEISRDETMNYEEYSMSRYEIRSQRRFAQAFKRTFITHLKLRGIWQRYNIRDTDLDVEFEKPVLWDTYETQKLVTAKMEIYEKAVEQDELSKIMAMKKYLGMTDEDIDLNFRDLIKEKQYVALADYFSDKISDQNYPVDYTSPIRLAGIDGVKGNKPTGQDGGEDGDNEESFGAEKDDGGSENDDEEKDVKPEIDLGGDEDSGDNGGSEEKFGA